MLQNSNAISVDDSYVIERSLRVPAGNYLLRTPTSQGNLRNWTLSFWIKRAAFGDQIIFGALYQQVNVLQVQTQLGFGTNGEIYLIQYNSNLGYQANIITSAVLRDPSAWYHITYVWDTPNSVASDRVRIYLNNERITSFSTSTYPVQNLDGWINNISTTPKHGIGILFDNGPAQSGNGSIEGYLAEFNFIDGQSLDSSSFGKINTLTNQWVAKKYTGAYGTNGFYLDFKDGTSTATLGNDKSGNNNNWALTNFTRSAGVNDCWMRDTPSNNFATFNPLSLASTGDVLAMHSHGNLIGADAGNVSVNSGSVSTIAVTSGKWACEQTMLNQFAQPFIAYGSHYANPISTGVYYYGANGQVYKNGVSIGTFATFNVDDVIRLELDADNKIVTFFKNNTLVTSTSYITNNPVYIGCQYANTADGACFVNFGQRDFAGTPTAGFKSLCTSNLPAPSIFRPKEHFDVSLWTGNQLARTISTTLSEPDLIWTKCRSTAESHRIHDTVRGSNGSVLYELNTNETAAEGVDTLLSGVTQNGFTISAGANSPNVIDRNYVAWLWKASNFSPVTNNVGTISSQVSANTSAGFSIVKHINTGSPATIGHGLGVAPKIIINKVYDRVENWRVYFGVANEYLILNSTNAKATDTNIWNNTQPTSSVFSIGTYFNSGDDIISYCFAEISGYSKFDSYTGNGSADGAFVYTGFRPRYIMVKCIDTAGRSWPIFDSSRVGHNPDNNEMFVDLTNIENTADLVDILSNGFKFRSSDTFLNASGSNYIYMAFAETPFQYSNAR